MSNIEHLPPLREIIAHYKLSANKALGQNFLLDQNITDKIARQIDIASLDHVIEVGPGPGGLTRSLLRAGAPHVLAIERDERAIEALSSLKDASEGRLEIRHEDAQDFSLSEFAQNNSGGRTAIVANLPYNIATPLLISWLEAIYQDPNTAQAMVLMFQKEVAQRILAKPGTKNYGRLSVLSQWLCDVRSCFDLPPSAFVPPPKVTSTVLCFTPKKEKVYNPAFSALGELTKNAFGQRRKMLRSSLKNNLKTLETCGIDATQRAENLSVEDFLKLAVHLKET